MKLIVTVLVVMVAACLVATTYWSAVKTQNNVLIHFVETEGPDVDDQNNESNNTENHHVQIGTIDNHSQTDNHTQAECNHNQNCHDD
ncbi:hypothetical protein DAPPUDRAFT_329943 [Daphnia pulex]|uniref:Uncharacterized protein n=1 Tax=Daphnia pulex TaxID=6669 RepID=E9HI30_DAPPU|nr:hypothetical protein DAPPUDRAFT_329943 [Daphnia pulex]|eukprot:EFX68612.1 hypothetical protein DAPPUDRAFT_329943 [Daphnia pulex]